MELDEVLQDKTIPFPDLPIGGSLQMESDAYYMKDPTYVGEWVIGDCFHIMITARPKWIHRFFMKHLLGIKYVDLKSHNHG